MLLSSAPPLERATNLEQNGTQWVGKFQAMSCPCEILIDHSSRSTALRALDIAAKEAWRIEQKYSRFIKHSVTGTINSSTGHSLAVDHETANLLDCADTLYNLSEGMFDITAGVLGTIWTFNPAGTIPNQSQINELLPHIGWDKVQWQTPELHLPKNMKIDFGGIGKEYAVDRSLALINGIGLQNVLVNYGGDIAASAPHADGSPWNVGIETTPSSQAPGTVVQLSQGGIATSGDQRRYIDHQGTRYSHILNPKTGWPIQSSNKTITTLAGSATEAGMYATLAMLIGDKAEQFLIDNEVTHWIQA